ncbi:endospore germination permease [Oscillospiraceae bacterium MB08-C2-2]|nr:endospore germination permease [Oscillospiraceae bacterium MB08-C2-2]
MQSEKLSLNQAIFVIMLFNIGSSVIMGISTKMVQDTWLVILVATFIAIPVFWLYARILQLFPEKNIFQILELLLGKIGGKAVSVLFIWYSLHLSALVLRNLTEFVEISSLPETPQLPIMILLILTTVYLARSGIHTIGKWSIIMVFFVLFVVFITFSASIGKMRFDDILPIMEHSPAQIAQTGFETFSYPYGETIIFLYIGHAIPKGKTYKVYFRVLAMCSVVFLLVFFRNIVLVGRGVMTISFFPSYITARVMEIGDFLARLEGAISSNMLLAGIVKISVCLRATSEGVSHLFNLKDYKTVVLPVGILSLALCSILYENTMDMFLFLDYYGYYALPFQLIIPLLLLIVGEVHIRRDKNKKIPGAAAGI